MHILPEKSKTPPLASEIRDYVPEISLSTFFPCYNGV